MQAIHDYAVPLRNLLCRCTDIDRLEAERARFYYEMSMGCAENTLARLDPEYQVCLIEDSSETGEDLEWRWSGIESDYCTKAAST